MFAKGSSGRNRFAIKIILVLIAIFAVAVAFYYDLHRSLDLENLKLHLEDLQDFRSENPISFSSVFFLIYVTVTGLSIPGALVMTLAAGALFGLVYGTVLVSFASTTGATVAFLASRLIISETVQKRFPTQFDKINAGIEREGAFYLFSLRLIPQVPFFLINLMMGLTKMRLIVFYFVSQLGMLPGTIAYVNAGTQLSKITSLRGIVSPNVLVAFVILGILPFVLKRGIGLLRNGKI